eukprot:SAG11_NODE_29074_length_314_cov_8.539535_1_plen_45_part_01
MCFCLDRRRVRAGFRYSLVLKNQVPVVIYGIHGAWIYSTPYVPVP